MLKFLKNCIVLGIKGIIGLFLILFFIGLISGGTSKKSYEQPYDIGYLKKGAVWRDKEGNNYKNLKQVEVEIWRQKIVAPSVPGGKLTQIYFLEGENLGVWGYTIEEYVIKK